MSGNYKRNITFILQNRNIDKISPEIWYKFK
ncbi:endopeptidase lytE domain protein [Bacillus pseudomycoides]|nr:endopeptidase lytE domain protein [Bacillus pseudomycoides]